MQREGKGRLKRTGVVALQLYESGASKTAASRSNQLKKSALLVSRRPGCDS